MDFNKKLCEMLEEVSDMKIKKFQLENEKKEELKRIEEKYEDLKQKIDVEMSDKNSQINQFCNDVVKYSTFNIDKISNAIAKLMSIYEGKTYIVRKIRDGKRFELMISPEYYGDIRENLTLALEEKEEITFYENFLSDYLYTSLKLKRYAYLYKFINYLIEYKMKINIIDISDDEINMLIEEFVKYNIEKIKDNYEQRKKSLITINGYYERDFVKQENELKRILKKAEK